jgi:hypothetical protein
VFAGILLQIYYFASGKFKEFINKNKPSLKQQYQTLFWLYVWKFEALTELEYMLEESELIQFIRKQDQFICYFAYKDIRYFIDNNLNKEIYFKWYQLGFEGKTITFIDYVESRRNGN